MILGLLALKLYHSLTDRQSDRTIPINVLSWPGVW